MAQDRSIEHCQRTLSVCESLYGSFYQKFINVPDKSAEEVRDEIMQHINDQTIQIDLYIYIMNSKNGTMIKSI